MKTFASKNTDKRSLTFYVELLELLLYNIIKNVNNDNQD